MSIRGVRNNNPGNIRKGDPWYGATGVDDVGFITFEKPEFGIRAMAKILLKYQAQPPAGHGLRTIAGMVNRWAPPNENDTAAYIEHVCECCGSNPTGPYILTPSRMLELVKALIKHECAGYVYPEEIVRSGVDLAYQQH